MSQLAKVAGIAVLWLVLNAGAQHLWYPLEGPRNVELYASAVVIITVICVLIWRFVKLPKTPTS